MSAKKYVFCESLESRTLMSATPSPAVVAAETKLLGDLATYSTDKGTWNATILKDLQKLAADQHSASTVDVSAQVATLQQDRTTLLTTLLSDKTAFATTVDNARIAVLNDAQTVRTDKQTNSANLTADEATLANARLALANDRASERTTLINDNQTLRSKVLADRQAIIAARLAGGTNTQFLTDRQQLVTDRQSRLNVLSADTLTIVADRQALAKAKLGVA
jgi:hypothetical protein